MCKFLLAQILALTFFLELGFGFWKSALETGVGEGESGGRGDSETRGRGDWGMVPIAKNWTVVFQLAFFGKGGE
ncbi:hypothetical protein CRP01_37570 [Flavilitoribacter nigricans DSM 23189 = NBRC 102662]|uniref:Uncharacterized protein n=1 Tax=Flavilitoribacter nigricans (strain ATCC 23147 / DSM 23189 / NBRC 102662 / NCIMB 1420 / SS-2) TaxID=1122177 RepID=A0A2D0MZ23_FLAN2|nr:hypothetical protein CRP01_37570 [Flavilitoribacter nigricans DSM 23189 = NBRC 102662]